MRIDEKTGNRIVLLLLFLTAMNFQAKFFYFIFAATLAAAFAYKNTSINRMLFLYFILGSIMAVYNVNNGIISMLRFMAYPAAYYIGISMSRKDSNYDESVYNHYLQERICNPLFVISLGSFSHYILNYFTNFNNMLKRNTNDIWTGEMLSATGQSSLACLMIGFAVAMILTHRKTRELVFGIIFIVGVLAYNLVLSGRTIIAILLIVFSVGFLYMLKQTSNVSKKMKVIGGILLLVVVASILWMGNVGGIKDYIEKSNLYLRFLNVTGSELLESGRMDRRIFYLSEMITYPFGGAHMRNKYGYAHDLLLDGYDEYGLVVFVILFVLLINGIKQIVRFCKDKGINLYVKTRFLCVYVAILLVFCVEPILAGMQWLFVCFCLINGMITGYNYKRRQMRIKEIEA